MQGFGCGGVSLSEAQVGRAVCRQEDSGFGKGRHHALRILLVDDDPALRTLLRTTYEVADVAVVDAKDAVEARREIRTARPDVIVLDVNMPGTTGLELCAELKAAPATRDIPIVLLTGAE